MYNVTQSEKDAYRQTGSVKRGYINIVPLSDEEPITLDEYSLKSFTILDDIYTPEEGIIGSVIAKQLTLNLFKPGNIDLTDREVEAFIGIDVREDDITETKYVPYGKFIVQKPENEQVTEKTSFEALDFMVKFNLKYEDRLEYPCQAKDVLNSICELCGVELGTENFANEDFEIENNQFVGGESCRDVLKAICQLSGTYARIGRDNKLYLNFPTLQSVEEITKQDYMPNIKINNKFGPVNRLVLRMSQVEGENVVEEDTDSIEQYGLTELVIYDNPFTYTQEKRESAIRNIWDKVRGFTYTDYDMKVVPRPYLDSGDGILLKNVDGTAFYSFLFTHEVTYSGGLSGSMSAVADTKAETKYAFLPALANRLKHTEFVVDKANQTITSIVEIQEEQRSQMTQILQNIESINASVKTIGGNNKQSNSVGAFGTEEYEQSEEGNILALETTDLRNTTESGRMIYITDKKWFKLKSQNLVVGNTYTLSFKYINEELNKAKISLINNISTTLVDTNEEKNLTEVVHTFTALSETVELLVETGNYGLGITDYYLQTGTEATVWQPAQGEVQSTSLEIYYNGIKVTSANSEIITEITNLGFTVKNVDGKMLITFNKDEAILGDTNINGVLKQSHWKRQVVNVERREILVEVYEE